MKTEILEIYGLSSEGIAYCEAEGLAKCFSAYASECAGEWISGIGFNQNSGYVYIALENGVQIASCLGREVEFLATDYMNGEEFFCSSYNEALSFYEKMQEDEE